MNVLYSYLHVEPIIAFLFFLNKKYFIFNLILPGNSIFAIQMSDFPLVSPSQTYDFDDIDDGDEIGCACGCNCGCDDFA